MASTNLQLVIERNKKLQALATAGQLPVNILARLADTTLRPYLSDLKNNVHRDGIKKTYSQKEAWYAKDSFYKTTHFRKVGKPNAKGEARETKTTMYLKRGYEQLREIQGFKTDKVYIEVSGDFKNSVVVDTVGNSNVVGINDASQVGKYEGLLKKYGKFYKATKEQLQALHERTREEIHLITVEQLKA